MSIFSAGEGERLGMRLECSPDAAAAARQAVVAADGSLPEHVRDDLLLLVTELVTNAVRHAGAGPESAVDLSLRMFPGRIRVEVGDPGPGFTPAVAPPQASQSGGWGLYLVETIAHDWGVVTADSGTSVWFELRHAA